MTQKAIEAGPQAESCAPGQAEFSLDENRKSGEQGQRSPLLEADVITKGQIYLTI